jgi:hypothetical protein
MQQHFLLAVINRNKCNTTIAKYRNLATQLIAYFRYQMPKDKLLKDYFSLIFLMT